MDVFDASGRKKVSEGCPDNERLERLSRENHKIQSASLLESTQNISHFFARNKDNYDSHNLMFHVFSLKSITLIIFLRQTGKV